MKKIDKDTCIVCEKEIEVGDFIRVNLIRYEWLSGFVSKIDTENRTFSIDIESSSTRIGFDYVKEIV